MKNKNKKLEDLKTLKNILKYTNKKLVFADLKASQTGMSRTFKIYVIKKGELYNITRLVASITDNTFTSDYKMRIYGCGMDMLFETCYQLNSMAKWLDGYRGKKKTSYNYLVKTSYDLI